LFSVISFNTLSAGSTTNITGRAGSDTQTVVCFSAISRVTSVGALPAFVRNSSVSGKQNASASCVCLIVTSASLDSSFHLNATSSTGCPGRSVQS
jgi:hypothetical protein